MSLLATASPWNVSDDSPPQKKRTPMLNSSIRKTVRNRPANADADNEEATSGVEPMTRNTPLTISDVQSYNSDKQTRVHKMLDQMTMVNSETDNSKMGDFTPMRPLLTTNKPTDNGQNALLPKPAAGPTSAQPGVSKYNASYNTRENGGVYAPNEPSLGKYTNYRMAHDSSLLRSASLPETAKFYGSGRTGNARLGTDEQRLMEKINYMIHLLEEQQMEKTNNVMEEFILYSLLGVFVIYVVDSFSRAGKYMR
jgi:hypothetical protein